MPKFARVLANAVLLGIVAAVDYATGTELQFSVFYFVPIALIAWYVGPNAAVVAAIASSAIWWGVDVVAGRVYRTELIEVANYTLRLISFVAVAVVSSRLRQWRDDERQLNAELQKTVGELKKSMSEIDKLRNEMQRVCAWTNRIESEGKWVAMDKFLADKLHFRISHGISDEGMEQLRSRGRPGERAGQAGVEPASLDEERRARPGGESMPADARASG